MSAHGPWRSLSERMMQLEATVAELQAKNERMQQRLQNATEAEEIIRRVSGAPPLPPAPRHKRPNPHGLHVVHCTAAAGAGAVAWVVRSRAHRAVALALMAVVGTAGVAAAPVVTGAGPVHAAPARVHRHHRTSIVMAPILAPRRNRRRADASESPAAPPRSRTAKPEPSPAGSRPPVPTPSPLASVPPLCVTLPDKACDRNPQCVCPPDRDGDADDVLASAA